VQIRDKTSAAELLLVLLDRDERPDLVSRWVSRDYGAKSPTVAVAWTVQAHTPLVIRWAIVPVCKNDRVLQLELIEQLRRETGEIRFGVSAAAMT